ncbi:hypothetical protein [Streptomyces sp. TLI_171]|nr:hypothetical protein [Streptomyces sp. TLI_171]
MPGRAATGNDTGALRLVDRDLTDLQGRTAQLQVRDDATGRRGT